MAYTQEGIMSQILVAFGQGAGAIRVSQDAALELRRWYFDAITPQIIDQQWETSAVQLLERARAIGSLAALKATTTGATAIGPKDVYASATQMRIFDCATGVLMVEEVGGVATDLGGRPLGGLPADLATRTTVLASAHPDLHRLALDIMGIERSR